MVCAPARWPASYAGWTHARRPDSAPLDRDCPKEYQGTVALEPRTYRGEGTISLCHEWHRNERSASALGCPPRIRCVGCDGQVIKLREPRTILAFSDFCLG